MATFHERWFQPKADGLPYKQIAPFPLPPFPCTATRDEAVLNQCVGRGIPEVGLIGGGYDKNCMALITAMSFCITAQRESGRSGLRLNVLAGWWWAHDTHW
ncbi:hypothetical protein [Pseudomonas frederiksbergensis]|uniref:Histone deacetylase domain-containing protein n=1 Tax=Pseudomonas frederiksbergensis TaxID=104087 RepID=A0A423HIJ7_9PSED|nr:hypothetical protein BK662_29105 [Pseudomonas frederiksbergensis]